MATLRHTSLEPIKTGIGMLRIITWFSFIHSGLLKIFLISFSLFFKLSVIKGDDMSRGLNLRLPWSNMAGQFRSSQWDPVLIIAQIIAMISWWYFSLGMWVFVLDVIGKFDLSIEQMFTQSDLGLYEDSGRTNIICYTLNSLSVSFIMWGVVGRTKQCLDFAATIHLFHFFVCWGFFGYVPVTFWWWVTNVGCVALTTVLSEYLCMRSEMKAIPVGMGPKVDL